MKKNCKKNCSKINKRTILKKSVSILDKTEISIKTAREEKKQKKTKIDLKL